MSKNAPIIIKMIFIAIIVIGIIGYIFFNTRLFIQGPQIIVYSPTTGETSDSKLIEVSGQVLNATFISINDRPILIDEVGNFTENILLHEGHNVILLRANDKFERQVIKKLNLVYNIPRDERLNVPAASLTD